MTTTYASLPLDPYATAEAETGTTFHPGMLFFVFFQMCIIFILNEAGNPGGFAIAAVSMAPIVMASLFQPLYGLCMLFALQPFDFLFGLGEELFTYSKFVAIFTTLGFVLRSQRREYTIFPPERVTQLGTAYVLWALLSVVWSVAPARTFFLGTSPIMLMFLTIATVHMLNDRKRVLTAMLCYGLSNGVAGVLMALKIGPGIEVWHVTRTSIVDMDPNELARTMVMGVFAVLYSILRTRSWLLRIVLISMLPFMVVGILQTQSRSSLAAMCLAICVAIAFGMRGNIGQKALTLISLIGSGVVMIVILMGLRVLSPDIFSRWSTLDRAAAGRLYIIRTGIAAVQKNPVLGVGHGQFGTGYSEVAQKALRYGAGTDRDAHSCWVAALVELGPIGFSLFAAWMAMLARCGFRIRPGPEAMLGLSTMALIILTTFSYTLWSNKFLYSGIGIVAAMSLMAPKRTDELDEFSEYAGEAQGYPGAQFSA